MNYCALISFAAVYIGAYAGGVRGLELVLVALGWMVFCAVFRVGRAR